MSQAKKITALDLTIPVPEQLSEPIQQYFDKCQTKLGMIPNVLTAYSHNNDQLEAFLALYDQLMLGDSDITALEKEMIAVVVSATNHCYYCLVAHGQAVRALSNDPVLGEQLVMNYRTADLSSRHRAMLDFSVKLTELVTSIGESDRQQLRDVGLSDQAIWDIANICGFYNMTNRVASAVEMQPNPEYHHQNR